jgi:hypothetical protein
MSDSTPLTREEEHLHRQFEHSSTWREPDTRAELRDEVKRLKRIICALCGLLVRASQGERGLDALAYNLVADV